MQQSVTEGRRGREARRTSRLQRSAASVPYIRRGIPITEMCSASKALEIIEHNAETLLEEIGIEFRGYARALELLKGAGCDIQGERVHFPRGLARTLVATAPRDFMQHARNPERSVHIGGTDLVFAPVYGSPFVHDLDSGPPLRHDRGLPQFREARLCEPVHAPFGRHGVRAGRPAGQQAPSRNELCAHALVATSPSWAR